MGPFRRSVQSLQRRGWLEKKVGAARRPGNNLVGHYGLIVHRPLGRRDCHLGQLREILIVLGASSHGDNVEIAHLRQGLHQLRTVKTQLRALIEDTIREFDECCFCYVYDKKKDCAVRVDPEIVTRLKTALRTGGILIGEDKDGPT